MVISPHYEIIVKKRTLKSIQEMPESIQRKGANIVEDLRDKGPLGKDWPKLHPFASVLARCIMAWATAKRRSCMGKP